MNEKNNEAFLRSIKGTKPIKKGETVLKKIPQTKAKTKQTVASPTGINPNPIIQNYKKTKFESEKLSPNKKLRKGKIPINIKIDFHGLSVYDAENYFKETIKKNDGTTIL